MALVVGVRVSVARQVRMVFERFPAQLAREWTLVGVQPAVSEQRRHCREGLVAYVAHKWLVQHVSVFVLRHGTPRGKRLSTQRTKERILVTVYALTMTDEVARPTERLLTQRTLVRLQRPCGPACDG